MVSARTPVAWEWVSENSFSAATTLPIRRDEDGAEHDDEEQP